MAQLASVTGVAPRSPKSVVALRGGTDEAGAKTASAATFSTWKPAGPHDEVRPLLFRLGLQKYSKLLAKHDVLSLAMMRSMIAMNSFHATLKAIGIDDDAELTRLQAAVLSAESIDADAALALSATLPPEEEDEEPPEPEAAPVPSAPHKVYVSKKEVDEIMQWSDDEDMTTAQGRFKHRQKTNVGYEQSHDMQYMMRDGDEGSITDVSRGPRSILKKLLKVSYTRPRHTRAPAPHTRARATHARPRSTPSSRSAAHPARAAQHTQLARSIRLHPPGAASQHCASGPLTLSSAQSHPP